MPESQSQGPIEPDPKPRQSRLLPSPFPESIFADENGVRAIWRVLIYFGWYYALRFVLLFAAGQFIGESADNVSPLWLLLLEECLLVVAAFAPAVFLAKIEMRPFGAFGLPIRGAFKKEFWSGVAWGLAAITLLLLVMRGIGVFQFGKLGEHAARALKFGAFWGVMFLVVGFYEDFLYRGYSLITLSEATGFWPAAVLLSVAFGSIHLWNPGESVTGALGAACIGLFFCLTLRRTGTLWFAVGMHAAWDWGESFLYSVPDSGMLAHGRLLRPSFHGPRWLTGGSVGPEGSVLLFVLIAVMWVVFDSVYPAPSKQPGGF
ncbi:MAG TPA: type II CAAX endopeptidase family protein [Terriglobales bacterium]|nr:type II CAAX endopeptidase family protein [Terriglobales bacterium]